MGSFSIWHALFVFVSLLLYLVPTVRIIKRAGFSPYWAALCFIPLVNYVALWVFAYSDWPALSNNSDEPEPFHPSRIREDDKSDLP
jgi:hypothetical protein